MYERQKSCFFLSPNTRWRGVWGTNYFQKHLKRYVYSNNLRGWLSGHPKIACTQTIDLEVELDTYIAASKSNLRHLRTVGGSCGHFWRPGEASQAIPGTIWCGPSIDSDNDIVQGWDDPPEIEMAWYRSVISKSNTRCWSQWNMKS